MVSLSGESKSQPVDSINSVTAPPPLHRYIFTFTERMKNYIIPSLLISVALVLSAYLLSASIRDHANALRESGSEDRKVEFDLSGSMKTLIWGQRRRAGGGIPVYVEPSSSIHLIEE
ncbi:Unannotated [Lentimonas sp. CC4]|nr:Unannotated [Lentimonas sp. CC4]CAA6687031.1 Unannotated [Lentimonas sp. CC6]CAA7076196.1 Unannotated [Lentimonas sp. CC4]CAA7171156.1 Unannotated [Lentimonas sp. CC21]CAA7182737.1 Unannotated [Lentimonas sp. CC8]